MHSCSLACARIVHGNLSWLTAGIRIQTSDGMARGIQQKRWQLRLATGFEPARVQIPKRFREITTWKGQTDAHYLDVLMASYARAIETWRKPRPMRVE